MAPKPVAPCCVDGCAVPHTAEFTVTTTTPASMVMLHARIGDALAPIVEVDGRRMLLLCPDHESVLREAVGDTAWSSP